MRKDKIDNLFVGTDEDIVNQFKNRFDRDVPGVFVSYSMHRGRLMISEDIDLLLDSMQNSMKLDCLRLV